MSLVSAFYEEKRWFSRLKYSWFKRMHLIEAAISPAEMELKIHVVELSACFAKLG